MTVFARDEQKGRSLADEFSADYSRLDHHRTAPNFSEFNVVVNATPLGTSGPLENDTIAAAGQIRDCCLVYDLVYNPPKTKLLREADLAGVPSLNGLDMLINQGAKQFEIWSGRPAPVDSMKAAAIQRLSQLR